MFGYAYLSTYTGDPRVVATLGKDVAVLLSDASIGASFPYDPRMQRPALICGYSRLKECF